MRTKWPDLVCRDLLLRGPPPVSSTVRRDFSALAVTRAVAEAVSLASAAANPEQGKA
jgi:hypothetical protein